MYENSRIFYFFYGELLKLLNKIRENLINLSKPFKMPPHKAIQRPFNKRFNRQQSIKRFKESPG